MKSAEPGMIEPPLGGAIEVETEPGAFTEFRIILPRNAASISSGGKA